MSFVHLEGAPVLLNAAGLMESRAEIHRRGTHEANLIIRLTGSIEVT
jgi:hypothetical protein